MDVVQPACASIGGERWFTVTVNYDSLALVPTGKDLARALGSEEGRRLPAITGPWCAERACGATFTTVDRPLVAKVAPQPRPTRVPTVRMALLLALGRGATLAEDRLREKLPGCRVREYSSLDEAWTGHNRAWAEHQWSGTVAEVALACLELNRRKLQAFTKIGPCFERSVVADRKKRRKAEEPVLFLGSCSSQQKKEAALDHYRKRIEDELKLTDAETAQVLGELEQQLDARIYNTSSSVDERGTGVVPSTKEDDVWDEHTELLRQIAANTSVLPKLADDIRRALKDYDECRITRAERDRRISRLVH